MPDAPSPDKPRPVAWGPIILLCGIVIYLIGLMACWVAAAARGWFA